MGPLFEEVALIRLQDTLWSYTVTSDKASFREIRLRTPPQIDKLAYRLAHIAATHLSRGQPASLCSQLHFEDDQLQGRWKIVPQGEKKGLWYRLLQWFPFTRMITSKKIMTVHVEPVDALARQVMLSSLMNSVADEMTQYALPFDPDLPLSNRLLYHHFQDPFTQLATLAFQTVERLFVSGRQVEGSFRFVLKNKKLQLLPRLLSLTEEEKTENREAVAAFQQFAIQEYGCEHIAYLEQAYGFFFSQMIEAGEPLLPAHIFKTNIGVMMIQLHHVETFYEKLCILKDTKEMGNFFSVRELRGLMRSFPAVDALHNFLNGLEPCSVKNLPEELFNTIVDMMMPTAEEREMAFTGRKIRHRAVCGWTAKEELFRENPALDLFELLHLFDELQKSDFQNFFELLAHVVAKRNLFASRLVKDTIVIVPGLLIPAPSSKDGKKRWYYSEALVSDQEGNFHYVLLPACERYADGDRALPMIKLYRSTVSERNNIDWLGSLKADFNPYGSPAPLQPDKALSYERPDLEHRTVPLWVAYLMWFERGQDHDSKAKALRSALVEFLHAFPAVYAADQLVGEEAIYRFLHAQAEEQKELPQYKIHCDIAFVGHSLGATLCEYYMAKRRDRIPLPGCCFICYSANAPAIDDALDLAFIRFGRQHMELFQALEVGWKITRQLEYGDFFVQGGGAHLGTTDYRDEDCAWLQQHSYVFQPKEEAEALTITTLPAHGRRIGAAVEGQDYTITTITPNQLYEFDHAWWISKELREIFGFRLCQSPMLMEKFRRTCGRILQPLFALLERRQWGAGQKIANRDAQGILFARHTAPDPTQRSSANGAGVISTGGFNAKAQSRKGAVKLGIQSEEKKNEL